MEKIATFMKGLFIRPIIIDKIKMKVLHKTLIYKVILIILGFYCLISHLTAQVSFQTNQVFFSNDYSPKRDLCTNIGLHIDNPIKISQKGEISPIIGFSNTNYKWIRNDRLAQGQFNNNQSYVDGGIYYGYDIIFIKGLYKIPVGQSLYNKDQRPKVIDIQLGVNVPYKQWNIFLFSNYGKGIGSYQSNLDWSGYNFQAYTHNDNYVGYGICLKYTVKKRLKIQEINDNGNNVVPDIQKEYPEIRDYLLKDSVFGTKMKRFIEKVKIGKDSVGERRGSSKTTMNENH